MVALFAAAVVDATSITVLAALLALAGLWLWEDLLGQGRPVGTAFVGESMTPASAEPLHPAAREMPPAALASYPPVERWDDWVEYDPVAWPRARSSAATR